MLKKSKIDKSSRLFIGTSGWIYGHWQGIFYPEDLPSKEKLKYYSQYFKTAEINYSFYHLPRPKTYKNWYEQVPDKFVFALKASRFITHIKRLKNIKKSTKIFIKNALNLKEKLGPILFQFPSSFKATEENLKRLKDFLKYICEDLYFDANWRLRFAFEFRHQTWCHKEIYNLLKKYNVAWVIADSPRYPKIEIVTADFAYFRLHGSQILFGSKYSKEELKNLSKKIKEYLKQGLDVYVYFNNDAYGYAVENAQELQKMLK